MKRILTFLAGLMSGVGLTLWWGGRIVKRKLRTKDAIKRYIAKVEKEVQPFKDSLADTQEIKVSDERGTDEP